MSDSREIRVRSNGIGLGSLLFITFLVLKLTGVITWSWWWITAPLWIPLGFIVIIFIIGLVLTGIIAASDSRSARRRPVRPTQRWRS